LFDHAADSLAFPDEIIGFEMQDVMQHKAAIVPVLSYVLHRIAIALDGTPAILVMDEAWTLLDDPFFAARLGEWLDMLRAKNAMVIFATEHMAEAGASNLNKTLMPKIATQIYLPDDVVDPPCADAFGLTEADISYLSAMNTEDRHFLLKRGKDALVMALDLTGMSDIIAVLSATLPHLEIMEQVIEAQSREPAQWMPKFLERI
jgi:type IV secretion system protein VirB4